MPSTDNKLTVSPATDAEMLRPIVRPAVAGVGVLALLVLVALVPGIERLLSWLPVGVEAALLATGGFVAASALLVMAPRIEAFTIESLTGPIELVQDAATVVRALVTFLAVGVAYAGLSPAFRPLFVEIDAAMLFDGTFGLVALGLIAVIGYLLYRNQPVVIELVTDRLADSDGGAVREGQPQFDMDDG